MNDIDFTMCKFIRDELSFLTYDDFCKNCMILKFIFERLDKNAKIFYKWYVYANIHIDEEGKNAIWNYLNNDEPEFFDKLIFRSKFYKNK